jgi:hypothetical protein
MLGYYHICYETWWYFTFLDLLDMRLQVLLYSTVLPVNERAVTVLRPTYWPCVDTYILHLSVVPVDLYWEVPVGNTRFTDWNFRGVAQSLPADSGIVPRLGRCCFLSYPFRFIIHLSSYHWRYTRCLYGVVKVRHQKFNALRKFGGPAAVYRQMVLLWIILCW